MTCKNTGRETDENTSGTLQLSEEASCIQYDECFMDVNGHGFGMKL